jgi:hypothetical protein
MPRKKTSGDHLALSAAEKRKPLAVGFYDAEKDKAELRPREGRHVARARRNHEALVPSLAGLQEYVSMPRKAPKGHQAVAAVHLTTPMSDAEIPALVIDEHSFYFLRRKRNLSVPPHFDDAALARDNLIEIPAVF